ncbi:hypothetical protein LNQ81_05380 [Myroides sp. M-43]|uniref:hypothetical protein n=1 Tax=Myroides oncorhynchi TaxID=2893756 RepID=UPI001E2C167F|nr:hypothetical protein [Myroides oncorhynchi]MCC9042122.1 hypothetical protein [Myroides oncorhynchi]
MRKYLYIGLIALGMVFTSCSKDDDSAGAKAEKEWIKFVQKHLIGEWTPYQIEVKPLIGAAVFNTPYHHKANCNKDKLLLKDDFTGMFNKSVENCVLASTNFKWNHKLGELSFTLQDGTEVQTILLKKSEKVLVLALPAKAVKPYLIPLFPEIEHLEHSQLSKLFANIILVKE